MTEPTPKMQQRLTRWGAFEDVDLPAIGAGGFKLTFSYSHAAQLTWTCLVPQHETPIPRMAFVRFWIDGANDPDGTPFSAGNPTFEGYVENAEPGGKSLEVNYTALDPTYRATKKVTVFSSAWNAGEPPDTPPTPATGSVPRLIYNVRVSNDPDWANQVGQDGTLGQIIAGLLEWCYFPLVWSDAAPGDGTSGGASVPFVSGDLSALTCKPQEKIDLQSESVRSAVERLQRYDPRYRLIWEPGTRLWRFVNITAATQADLTLNDQSADFPVVAMQLRRSTDNCITAISIYGPPAPFTDDLFWRDPVNPYVATTTAGSSTTTPTPNDIEPIGDPFVFETFTTVEGTFQARFWRQWQIVDPALRRGARELPLPYLYWNSAVLESVTERPTMLLSWDNGHTWIEWQNVVLDNLNGIITFLGRVPFFCITSSAHPWVIPGSTQHYFCPNKMRLIWAPYGPPLEVRRPSTGYEGTAYTEAGLEIEDYQNDEALMVGREYGQPVTTTERRAAFEVYAQTLLDQRKDVVWTGTAELDGLDWQYCRLARRCRILAKDADGVDLTTGWETITAYVTDVEYDLEEQMTTLTFSADKMALFGLDASTLKELLKIRPLEQYVELRTQFITALRPLPSGKLVNEVVGVQTTPVFHYVDMTEVAQRFGPDAPQAFQQAYQAYQQSLGGTGQYSPTGLAQDVGNSPQQQAGGGFPQQQYGGN